MIKSAKLPLALKRRVLSKKALNNWHFKQGSLAESKASAFLTKKNYRILERNLRFKNHELDLIALDQDSDEFVFVEVKWRQSDAYGEGSGAVTGPKLASMELVAKRWLKKQAFAKPYRFDIISLVGNLNSQALQISHFENITWL